MAIIRLLKNCRLLSVAAAAVKMRSFHCDVTMSSCSCLVHGDDWRVAAIKSSRRAYGPLPLFTTLIVSEGEGIV